ncbi:MAG: dihydrofolate reductase [Methylocystis sp.]
MAPELVIVAAVARNGVIGADNAMPWRVSSDLRHFKALTMGKPLILGRRTFQSLKRPLPGRRIIVVTREPNFSAADATTASDPRTALALARAAAREMGASEIMIGGGGEIYSALLNDTARIELTEIALAPEGDAFFPMLDMAHWRETRRETQPRGDRDDADFAFVTLERRRF